MGVITECGITIHDIVSIKPCRPDTKSSFESIFYRDHCCRYMPIVFIVVLKSCPVSCPAYKPTQLNTQWIRHGFKWSQGIAANNQPVCITAKLSAGSPI